MRDPRETGYGYREDPKYAYDGPETGRRYDCRTCRDTGWWCGLSTGWELVPCPVCADNGEAVAS